VDGWQCDDIKSQHTNFIYSVQVFVTIAVATLLPNSTPTPTFLSATAPTLLLTNTREKPRLTQQRLPTFN
jgi:hypothetical protein